MEGLFNGFFSSWYKSRCCSIVRAYLVWTVRRWLLMDHCERDRIAFQLPSYAFPFAAGAHVKIKKASGTYWRFGFMISPGVWTSIILDPDIVAK